MKKLYTLLLLSYVLTGSVFSQTVPPPYINYQAVLYDVNGPNPNAPYALQSFPAFVNISDELGNMIYREEHYASTDQNGVVTLKMGDGLYLSGTYTIFNNIPWETGKYYLIVEYDINGTISATAPEQLVSVPYSFYSGQAGNGITTVTDNGNGTLTFNFLDGSSYTTAPLTGIQGPTGATGPVGPQGPAGNDGTTGPQGPQGIQGIQGPAGNNGINGADGASAYEIWIAQGNTGTEADFLNALEGAQGPAGATGPQGPAGNDGATGPQGPQGIQGIQGPQGPAGRSAYESALMNGFVGTEAEWLASLEGPQGPAGNDGATGPQGVQGPAGSNGTNGSDGASAYEIWIAQGNAGTEADFLNALEGAQGPAGPTGAQGPAGNDGAQGLAGPMGPQGIPGPQGPEGPLVSGTSGQTLRHDGSTWVANSTLYNNGSSVGVGTTTPDASAILDVSSTSQGILLPKMTQSQRNAISGPVQGLLIFQTDNTPGFYYYDGSAWVALAGSSGSGGGSGSDSNTLIYTTDGF